MANKEEGGVVGAQWCAAGTQEVVLWQPACSPVAHVRREGDSHNSEPLFNVFNPPCLHIGSHKVILRQSNLPLLCAYQKFFCCKKTTSVYRGESRKAEGSSLLFTVRLSKLIQLSSNMDVFLVTPPGSSEPSSDDIKHRSPDYRVKASCIKNDLTIVRSDGMVVAKAHHMLSFTSLLCHKPYYKIVVYPGVDQAFITMLVAIQDRVRMKTHGNTSGG